MSAREVKPAAKPEDKEAATFGAFVRKPGTRRVAADVSGGEQAGVIEPVENLPDDAIEATLGDPAVPLLAATVSRPSRAST